MNWQMSSISFWKRNRRTSRKVASQAEEVRQRLAHQLNHVQQFGLGRRSFSLWRYKRGRRKVLAVLSILVAVVAATGGTLWFAETARNPTASEPLPAESFTGGETEFFTSLDATRQTLDNASRDTVYTTFMHCVDSWQHEVESLQRDLKKIESKSPVISKLWGVFQNEDHA